MRCAIGGCAAETRVIDSRGSATSVRRRRQCIAGHRFTTYEQAGDPVPVMVTLEDLQRVRVTLNGALRRALTRRNGARP